jgi:hypothetical protein
MKKNLTIIVFVLAMRALHAQAPTKDDVFQKANNAANKVSGAVNKVSSIIAVFQPYLLKARQLYYDAKQLGSDVKNSAKATFGKTGGQVASNATTMQNPSGSGSPITTADSSNSGQLPPNATASTAQNLVTNNQNGSGQTGAAATSFSSGAQSPQAYLPNQSLPINNPATVNNDGTGNWGNQNNGLYGNCLDALTGTVMGMGEAADKPTSVDLMFFAPADGQNSYTIMTPGFAKNNSTASYMTEHTSDQVQKWTDVNETEVALTKLTIGQFNQIQNNGQIKSAALNAQDYAGYYASVGEKLDGQVFAVKAQMENREVYALIAIIKQIGTSGSNGYLKIKVKALGVDTNGTGQVNASAYIRQ